MVFANPGNIIREQAGDKEKGTDNEKGELHKKKKIRKRGLQRE